MSGLPVLGPSALQAIAAAVDEGKGAVAQVLGQTYSVYRNPTVQTGAPSTVNNSIIAPANLIYAGYQARIRRITSRVAIENEIYGLLAYNVRCDPRFLQLQDVLVETGYGTDGGVYTFAQNRPTREILFVRTEANCSITRPFPKGGAESQMPVSGALASPGYGGIPKTNELVLTLTNGFYTFSPNGATPASVQCGLQPVRKAKDGNSLGTPTDLYRTEYLIYVPELPGELLTQLDRISFPTQDQYEIVSVFSSSSASLTGFTGNICVCEKLGV